MGYIENFLPHALARLGHEVHIVTSTAQVYYDQPFYNKTYRQFLGEPITAAGIIEEQGVLIHRLEFKKNLVNQIQLQGLTKILRGLQPDVVHTFSHADFDTLKLAFSKLFGARFKLFTANHNGFHALFPTKAAQDAFTWKKQLAWRAVYTIPGKFISFFIEKCFAVTTDAADIAHKWYGVPKSKLKVTPLGVDTQQFCPDNTRRQAMRTRLHFSESDIVCIHTGKLIASKNSLLLAKAIQVLNDKYHLPIKGLFIGEGEQAAALSAMPYCTLLPYQKHADLPDYYRAADVAVWHLSVTNSFFDAVASGLPLVCGDDVETYAAVSSETTAIKSQTISFDKNNSAYRPKIVSRFCKTHDLDSLVNALRELADPSVRKTLAEQGLMEIQTKYSWAAIAKARAEDYKTALKGRNTSTTGVAR